MQIGQKRQSGPERTQREGSRTVKGWYKALEDLVWLTQLGLNMLLPLVMCLGGAWWAVNSWVFVKERLDRSKKDKPRRTGFNSHL